MNNQTPEQFLSTLQNLSNNKVLATPEHAFMAALRKELLKNHFDRDSAQRLAGQVDIPLPVGATTEQAQEMAYYVASLIANCHDDLERCGFDGPDEEAAILAQRLVRAALV